MPIDYEAKLKRNNGAMSPKMMLSVGAAIISVLIIIVGAIWFFDQRAKEAEAESYFVKVKDFKLSGVRSGDTYDVKRNLEKAISLHPKAEYYRELAIYHNSNEESYQAIKAIEKALELEPNNPLNIHFWDSVVVALSEVTAEQKKTLDENTKKLVEQFPNDLDYLKVRAQYLSDEKKLKELVVISEKLIALQPSDESYRTNLAIAYLDMKNLDKALLTLEEAKKNMPHSESVLQLLAEVYLKKGQKNKAIETYQVLQRQNSDQEIAAAYAQKIASLGGPKVPEKYSFYAEAKPIPAQFEGDKVVVFAQVGHKPSVKLILDTGAEITLIKASSFKKIGLSVPSGAPTGSMQGVGGGQKARLVYTSIKLGPFEVASSPIAVVDADISALRGYDGMLGQSFLGNFVVQVNNQKQSILMSR